MAPKLTVGRLLDRMAGPLQLEHFSQTGGLEREVGNPDVSSPGLALAGYVKRFPAERLQVLGETEVTYLKSLDAATRRAHLTTFFSFPMPCVFITKNQEPTSELLELATSAGVGVIRTRLKTNDFYTRLKPWLEEEFAPSINLHGSLADVFGVGLLFVGSSGIGKSECVLDLVERGHRLVADDLVIVKRRLGDVLIGRGHELQRHHMEIRGVGVIDIPAIFGIHAVRLQKRIEVVVQLEDWETAKDADRTGLSRDTQSILEVPIPKVIVPLNPGKNITVVSEVVAMMHLLRYSGVDVATAFNERLIKRMREKRGVREYLRDDFE
jgi:HPr kinase/phosphorylase